MPHEVRIAPILVYPIDTSGVEADAVAYAEAHGIAVSPKGAEVKPAWAIVPTRAGLYAVCTEGVGAGPINEANPLGLDIFGRTYETSDGTKWLSLVPFATVDLADGDLIEMMTGESVPLHEWIRTFGQRLRDNYNIWERTLTAALAGEEA